METANQKVLSLGKDNINKLHILDSFGNTLEKSLIMGDMENHEPVELQWIPKLVAALNHKPVLARGEFYRRIYMQLGHTLGLPKFNIYSNERNTRQFLFQEGFVLNLLETIQQSQNSENGSPEKISQQDLLETLRRKISASSFKKISSGQELDLIPTIVDHLLTHGKIFYEEVVQTLNNQLNRYVMLGGIQAIDKNLRIAKFMEKLVIELFHRTEQHEESGLTKINEVMSATTAQIKDADDLST